MIQIALPLALQEWRQASHGMRIGFVPTMGALHAGHGALIQRARRECELVVVSIFVNPTQFNDAKDFDNYPTPIEADLKLCEKLGVDVAFMPTRESFYPDGYRYRVTEMEDSRALEGAHRPGHFDGVLTVVMKLLQVVMPDRAYFGEKDWQQYQLIRDMVQAFFMPIEVIPCPTVREADGLAMSSRNVRLNGAARAKASEIYAALSMSYTPELAAERLSLGGFAVEYVAEKWGRRLAAVVLDGVRLIDNISLEEVER